MKTFSRGDFHWDSKIAGGEKAINEAINILNSLSPLQIKAVNLFAKSRYEEGYDQGISEADHSYNP